MACLRKKIMRRVQGEVTMDRESIAYKLRRKAQVIAYHILPKKTLSGIYYRILVHAKLNLEFAWTK